MLLEMVFLELEQQADTPAFFCSLWSLLLLWAWEHIPLPVKRSHPPTWQPNCSFLMSWCLWRMRWLRPRRKEVSQDLAPQLTEFLQPLWMLKANRGKFLDAPTSDKVGRRLSVGAPDTGGLALTTSRFTGQFWGACDQGTRISSETVPVAWCVILQLWWIIHALVHLPLQCHTANKEHSSTCIFLVCFLPLMWTNIQFKTAFLIMRLFKAKICLRFKSRGAGLGVPKAGVKRRYGGVHVLNSKMKNTLWKWADG